MEDVDDVTCMTFVFRAEDHTLGNALRYIIMKKWAWHTLFHDWMHFSSTHQNTHTCTQQYGRCCIYMYVYTWYDVLLLCNCCMSVAHTVYVSRAVQKCLSVAILCLTLQRTRSISEYRPKVLHCHVSNSVQHFICTYHLVFSLPPSLSLSRACTHTDQASQLQMYWEKVWKTCTVSASMSSIHFRYMYNVILCRCTYTTEHRDYHDIVCCRTWVALTLLYTVSELYVMSTWTCVCMYICSPEACI